MTESTYNLSRKESKRWQNVNTQLLTILTVGIYRTHLYLLRFFHPFNPYNPCSFHHWVFCRTRIYRIDADEIKYQYIKIQKYIFLCFFLIFIYWCFINVVLSSRQPFLLLVIIPRLRPGLLSLRSVLASSQIWWLLIIFE